MSHSTNNITCTTCQSEPKVLCRTAQCYDCFKSHILRIFKQTLRTKIISKISTFMVQELGQADDESKSWVLNQGDNTKDTTLSNQCRKRLRVGIICSDYKYGLGRGIHTTRLLLHLLLLRNAHRKRLYENLTLDISSIDLKELLVTDDMEIVGIYLISDDHFIINNSNKLFYYEIPVFNIPVTNFALLEKIEKESIDASVYCRNIMAMNLLKNISVDLLLATNCLEDAALCSLDCSMLGLGGKSILRHPYLQPITAYNNRNFLHIGRPFRDLTAKEIYLLARHEKLINDFTHDFTAICRYQMEFLTEIGSKHPNSLKNIAKLTAGSHIECIDDNRICLICKFLTNDNDEEICSACLEISNISESAKKFLHSLI